MLIGLQFFSSFFTQTFDTLFVNHNHLFQLTFALFVKFLTVQYHILQTDDQKLRLYIHKKANWKNCHFPNHVKCNIPPRAFISNFVYFAVLFTSQSFEHLYLVTSMACQQ